MSQCIPRINTICLHYTIIIYYYVSSIRPRQIRLLDNTQNRLLLIIIHWTVSVHNLLLHRTIVSLTLCPPLIYIFYVIGVYPLYIQTHDGIFALPLPITVFVFVVRLSKRAALFWMLSVYAADFHATTLVHWPKLIFVVHTCMFSRCSVIVWVVNS